MAESQASQREKSLESQQKTKEEAKKELISDKESERSPRSPLKEKIISELKRGQKFHLNVIAFDKLIRFIQYSTRFLKVIPEKLLANGLMEPENEKDWQDLLRKFRREFSLCRRTLRFFRQLQILNSSYKLLEKYFKGPEPGKKPTKESNPFYVLFRTLNSLLALCFFSMDHIFWAYLAKLHRNWDLVKKVGDISDYIWIIQSLLSITTNIMEMYYDRQRATPMGLECIKNFTDMLTAIYFLDNKVYDEWFVGVFGCIGSAIGIYRWY